MGPAESFVRLFGQMTMPTACLWATGIILFCAEYFQPMRRVAYVTGAMLIAGALVTRSVNGDAGVAFMFMLVTVTLLFVVHAVSMYTQKRDWLRAARIEKADERSRRYRTLLGSTGTAITPIDLTGNVTVGDLNLIVYSDTPIKKGDTVRITEITPDKIIVKKEDEA